MADIYVRSTNSTSGDGSSWSAAYKTLAEADAVDVAGDRIFLSQAHTESISAAFTLALAGSPSNPSKVVCVNDSSQPPVSLASTSTLTGSGSATINFTGSAYFQGISVSAGSGSSSASITFASTGSANDVQVYENCKFSLPSVGTASTIQVGGAGATVSRKVTFRNCQLSFGQAGHRLSIAGADFTWKGGSFVSGSVTPTAILQANSGGRGGNARIDSVDLSALSASVNLVANGNMPGRYVFRNCKLPSGWTGSLFNTAVTTPGLRAEMYNCDAGDTNYRLWIEDNCGSIKTETVIVRAGGASDGTTPISYKMTSSANANYTASPLESQEMMIWNDTVGTAKTVSVEIVFDGATNLKDDEVWIELQYLGTSGVPLGSIVNDAKANILATAADQSTSSATWTTTGMTAPNRQRLSASITPQEKGFIIARVSLAKASTTIYIDPKLTVA